MRTWADGLTSSPVELLSPAEAIAIQRRLTAEFGGAQGCRDPRLLEEALARPRSGGHGTLAEMGAALFEAILANRPFHAGNKRAAFFITDVFLRLNGHCLAVDGASAERYIEGLIEAGECDQPRLRRWLSAIMEPLAAAQRTM